MSWLGFPGSDFLTTWVTRSILAGGGLAAIGLGALYCFQEKLIYIPKLPGVPNEMAAYPDRYHMDYEDVWLTTKDGHKLHAWFMQPKGWGGLTSKVRRSRPSVLFFQENAGNMSYRLPFLFLLSRTLDCSILAPSYRGYGLSQGRPNEPGLKLDSQAAFEHLVTRQDVDPRKVAIFGRSLGGAVAIHLTAANPGKVAALMVENTFTSIEDVAPKVLPMLSFLLGPRGIANWLVRNKWKNIVEIRKLTGLPLLLLSSLQDELLPPSQMRELRAAAPDPKRCTWVEFPYAGHMDAYELARTEYWPAVAEFFESHGLGASGKAFNEEGLDEDVMNQAKDNDAYKSTVNPLAHLTNPEPPPGMAS
ncbi:hypothetical protein WJX74_000226 [Apatococcus lobatus]|uniref:AB hydrolase-1 domain-containing protein n=1 Tax=Apatococcus lobatus TaxID=904363 RepID=A0AAW1RZ13_9CHLO